MRRWSCSRRR
jgi:hypothetical protein